MEWWGRCGWGGVAVGVEMEQNVLKPYQLALVLPSVPMTDLRVHYYVLAALRDTGAKATLEQRHNVCLIVERAFLLFDNLPWRK